MTTLSASNFSPYETLTPAIWETIIDDAVDSVNKYLKSYELPNLTGTTGSKTLTCTSKESGVIKNVVMGIYTVRYKTAGANAKSYNMGAVSESTSTSSGQTGNLIEELARSGAAELEEMQILKG